MFKLIIFALTWLALATVSRAELPPRPASALPSLTGLKSNERNFLPAEQAFQLVAIANGAELSLQFMVTPGYYLYKDRFRLKVAGGGLIAGDLIFSQAPQWKDDPEFGRVQVYHSDVDVKTEVHGQGELTVSWQGCAEAGLCYPPQSQTVRVDAPGRSPVIRADAREISIPIPTIIPTITYDLADEEAPAAQPDSGRDTGTTATEPPPAESFPLRDNPLLALATLWLLGVGLAFTPCVLPMLPIVAGIVARQHAANARQGFLLALAYGVGVATSYGTLGGLIALFGGQANLALWLQHPAVLVVFSLLFAVLALTSFDVFHLQLPSALQHRLDALSRRGKAGSYAGTLVMGFFSALVVSPCVSAPLAGVLLSVSTLGNAVMGFAALFALGFGLSTPLMILGASEGRFMPKSGLWMNRVKQAFGLMLLGVAITLLNRVLTGAMSLFLWGVLAAGTAFWINQWGGKWRVLWRSLAYVGLIWAAALLVGAASGGGNALQPLAHLATGGSAQPDTAAGFRTIHNSMELDNLLEQSRRENRPLLLDFYADWCVSCRIMEREVFDQPPARTHLRDWLLVRADITDNTPASRQLLQRFQLFGPPALIFFESGREKTEARLVGEVGLDGFLRHLRAQGLAAEQK